VTGVILLAFVVYKVAKAIFIKYNGHRYRLAFDSKINHSAAPALGSYSKVDLRVSNHATESLEWKKALISSAQHSIELSANFAGGEDFRDVLNLMEHRMSLYPDLKCHLILSSDLLQKQDILYLKKLKECYPHFNYLITERIYTLTPELLSEENHVKMLVVDGQYFAMGGTGIHEKMSREEIPVNASKNNFLADKLIDQAFRDTDIIGHGNAAQTMRNQFFNLYRIWEYRMTGQEMNRFFDTDSEKAGRCKIFHHEDNLIKDSSLKYVVSGPEHRNKNPISSEIADLTTQAKTEIRITNLLFNPDQTINAALKNAKDKKIHIKGYFNGTSKNSSSAHYLYALPNRYNYHLLTDVFEYHKKDQLYHKKVITVDSRYTVVGSFNLGVKSAKCDYENICVIDDIRVAQLMNNALDGDAKFSEHLTDKKLMSKWKWSQIRGKMVIRALGSLFG